MRMAKVFVGCSGWQYPHWREGVFYPECLPQKEEFNYYASKFSTVEINSTFYHSPRISVWEGWGRKAPEDFIYAVKMSRWLTHMKKLVEPKEEWVRFYEGAKKLGKHLGPILFQLPPSLHKDLSKLQGLVGVLPKKERFAFEFRNESWYDDEVYAFLRSQNWAWVIVSHPRLPLVFETTADFVYLRFHGSKSLYSSCYSDQELRQFAGRIKGWLKEGLDVYAYFNNDAYGFAPKNALSLKKMLP